MASEEAPNTAIEFREGMFQGDPEKMDEILAVVLDTVKALSRTTDPREMVTIFSERVGGIIPRDHTMTLTRRGLEAPYYRIARCSQTIAWGRYDQTCPAKAVARFAHTCFCLWHCVRCGGSLARRRLYGLSGADGQGDAS